jgi:phosphoribosylformylglycinamidine (FGAM) synthase-like amidotransferase family enzyme
VAPAPKGPSPTLAPKLRRVHVVTTFAGWNATSGSVEVGGYATVVERAGTCTLRLIHGDQVVTRKHTASADATTVACGGFSVPGSALTAGAWQAVLAYSSSKSTGEAAAVTVKVP